MNQSINDTAGDVPLC